MSSHTPTPPEAAAAPEAPPSADSSPHASASPSVSHSPSPAAAEPSAGPSAGPSVEPSADATAAAPSPARTPRQRPPVDLAACATELRVRFPAVFGNTARPLKLRIQADIQERAPGVFTRQALSAFLHRHTTSTNYLIALSQQPQRLDLDGQPAGEVVAEHRDAAAHEVERRRALRKEREAQMHEARRAARQAERESEQHRERPGLPAGERTAPRRPQPGLASALADGHAHAAQAPRPRRDEHARATREPQTSPPLSAQTRAPEDPARLLRARLLRDFDSSPLTKANFCALKGIAPEALDAQLAQARQEAAERLAARGPMVAPQARASSPPAQTPAAHAESRRERQAQRGAAPQPQQRESRAPHEPHAPREPREPREPRTPRAPREGREPQAAQAPREARTPREPQAPRGSQPAQAAPMPHAQAQGQAPSPPQAPRAPERVLAADALRRLVQAIVERGGSLAPEAERVARHLVDANLSGHDAQGVAMLLRYVDDLRTGALQPNREPEVVRDHGALLTLDGQGGYGATAGTHAMDQGIARAREHGVAVIALVNSHHLGRIGAFAERCLAAGLVSIHFVNVLAPAVSAPHGGSDLRLGANPLCVGLPLGPDAVPLLLDFATSRGGAGRARAARPRSQGPDAPLPFGGHKGYGLAMACELLAGALTGGLTLHAVPTSPALVNNMLSFIVDPERLGTAAHLTQQAQALAAWVKASPPARETAIMFPGEPEHACRERRSRDGIALRESTWEQILQAGVRLGLEEEALRALVQAQTKPVA